jgi:hypothetical protein
MSAPTQHIVLHQSVRNHPGVCAVQAAHAAGESVQGGPASGDTHVVALVAERSEDLESLSVTLTFAGIHHVVIREPDAPYNGAAVAVGVAPVVDREVVKPHVAHFKVLR